MDFKFELDRLRFEMNQHVLQLREDLDVARGDLLATNAVLHAVVATHPDRERLRSVLAKFDEQASERAKAGSTKCRYAYAGAMSSLEWTMTGADASVAG
ncbi:MULTISPECIES: hypothetical protein [unclassified Lysobacter]|uniref:hypothetical protein n=1 Tax=unclassified Lysobacter TaxID=2635362 RepID=UPI0006FFBAAB|nr:MULTISPECIES: hypothetical protein [unclassified Lysobacter]KRA17628.1 hypothetical protein ASD69_13205 [Lysobacter sp. Root604]KRD33967.1 hypothetical protein ASE35_09430 [Lysobacter sp. Root916]